MSYVPQLSNVFNAPLTEIANGWAYCKAAYDRAVVNYYNQCIELNPEGEAQQYWDRLKHPQSGINPCEVTDAMLGRFMNTLIEQGISKFSVDRFILELRRLRKVAQQRK